MAKDRKYFLLIDYLKKLETPLPDNYRLTFEKIENIISPNKISKSEKKSVVQKHGLGLALLEANYILSQDTDYKQKAVFISYNPQKAKEILQNADVDMSEIVLNNIFPNSSYLDNETNIGHEIIDIFAADGPKYYYYLNKDGQLDFQPKEVISITNVSKGLYKVINKAKIKKLLDSATKEYNPKQSYQKQLDKYYYNGHPIEEYLKNNTYNKRYNESTLVTFECDEILLPSHEMYIAFGKSNIEANSKKHIYKIKSVDIPRALRVINFSDSDKEEIKKIAHPSNWKGGKISTYADRYNAIKERALNYNDDLFEILGIDSLEIPYSNMLAYILKNTNLINSFLEFFFKTRNLSKSKTIFNVERETFNTDLLFTNFSSCKEIAKQKIFILENKIDSNITLSDRETKNVDGQIKKIYCLLMDFDEMKITKKDEKFLKKVKAIIKKADCKYLTKKHSQLSKYYIYAVITALLHGWDETKIQNDIRCAFLCPHYSRFLYETDGNYLANNGYALESKYLFRTYKDVKTFFEKAKIEIENESLRNKYKIFLSAVALKAKERDDSRELRMIDRFYRII